MCNRGHPHDPCATRRQGLVIVKAMPRFMPLQTHRWPSYRGLLCRPSPRLAAARASRFSFSRVANARSRAFSATPCCSDSGRDAIQALSASFVARCLPICASSAASVNRFNRRAATGKLGMAYPSPLGLGFLMAGRKRCLYTTLAQGACDDSKVGSPHGGRQPNNRTRAAQSRK